MKTLANLCSYLVVLTLIVSCSGSKRVEKNLNTGNYDHSINIALKKLRTNKQKKSNQKYIPMLEEAFAKAVERDMNTIHHLEQDGNPENLERIYNTYLGLKSRQDRIRPILPLYNNETGMEAYFKINSVMPAGVAFSLAICSIVPLKRLLNFGLK